MEVQRKCQWCGKPFIAHTMVTRFCSKSCTEKAYKDRKRKQKLQEYEARQSEQPMQEVGIVGGKPFLSPAEAATLLGISRATIYRHFAGVPSYANPTLKRCSTMRPTTRSAAMDGNRPSSITPRMRFWENTKYRRKPCIVAANYTTSQRLKKVAVYSTTAPS